MGEQHSSPLIRKKVQGKHVMQLLCLAARPPQERWSIRESVNFKIAIGRFGKDWPRVAQFVSTKNTHQICVYAEEYYLKHHHTNPGEKLEKRVYAFS